MDSSAGKASEILNICSPSRPKKFSIVHQRLVVCQGLPIFWLAHTQRRSSLLVLKT
jgi:hypothetical protein